MANFQKIHRSKKKTSELVSTTSLYPHKRSALSNLVLDLVSIVRLNRCLCLLSCCSSFICLEQDTSSTHTHKISFPTKARNLQQ